MSIEGIEQRKIEKADETCRRKIPPPAEIEQQKAQQRNSNCRREFRRGVKRGRGQAAFVCGEPVADGLRIGRKCRSLADRQEETRPKQTADACADARSKGSQA